MDSRKFQNVFDFYELSNGDFIQAAYETMLKRSPDYEGRSHYERELRNGASRSSILARLRFSPEGKAIGAPLRYVTFAAVDYLACKIPVLGYIYRWARDLLLLPVELHKMRCEYRRANNGSIGFTNAPSSPPVQAESTGDIVDKAEALLALQREELLRDVKAVYKAQEIKTVIDEKTLADTQREGVKKDPANMKLTELRKWASEQEAVFVLGYPRSGTTVLVSTLAKTATMTPAPAESFAFEAPEDLLRLKPDMMAYTYLGEAGLKAFSNFLENNQESFQFEESGRLAPESAQLLQLGYLYCAVSTKDGHRLLEKTPAHRNHVPYILGLFPKAKFVFCKRDAGEIIASHRKRLAGHLAQGVEEQSPSLNWLKKTAKQFCFDIQKAFSLAEELRKRWPERYLIISYDQLTHQPETTLSKVCDFVGVDFIDSLLAGKDEKIPEKWVEYPGVKIQPNKSVVDKYLTPEDLKIVNSFFPNRNIQANKQEELRFCSVPFMHARLDGAAADVRLCCPHWVQDGKCDGGSVLEKGSLLEAWNSEQAQEFRASILDGSYRFCKHDVCPVLKKKGALPLQKEVTDPMLRDILDRQATIVPPPAKVSLNYDSSCNLSCPQCREHKYIAKGDDLKKRYHVHKIIEAELDNPRELIITGAGDALASPVFRDFLINYDANQYKDTRIVLRTNANMFTEKMWEKMKAVQDNVHSVVVSLDAATTAVYDVVRRGGNFDILQKNMAFLGRLRAAKQIKRLDVEFCVQERNFREMSDVVVMCKGWNVDKISFSPLRAGGEFQGAALDAATVHKAEHTLHAEFVKALTDPCLKDPIVSLEGPLHQLALENGHLSSN